MKYIFLIIVAIILPSKGLLADSFDTHFNLVLPLTYNQLHLQFPDNKLTDISTLDISMISKRKSPMFWPQRIPFAAGISTKQNNLFYYKFEPLGFSQLIDIPIADPPIYDVSITEDGAIFSITSNNFYIHHYDFKSETISEQSKTSVQSPIKCVSNHLFKVGLLFSNSIELYRYRNDKLSLLKSITSKVNSALSDYICLNMAINSKGYILVICETDLLFFSPHGILLTSTPNTNSYQFADFTSYGDFILGSSKNTTLAKYTFTGTLLFTTSYLNPSNLLSDIIIYQPYGNLCLFSTDFGAYYTMKTSLTVDHTSYTPSDTNLSIDSKFKITFPSIVSISIIDAENNIVFLEKEKKFIAGNHEFSWVNLDPNIQKKSINFTAKGLYSNSNTIKITVPLTQSL
ncbi:hypothetical protein CL647_04490 [bacterium]|nr:hypothetical protein [Actinomycetota bacterium]MBE33359.1 hypothetical protein [bacterium]